MVTVIRRPSISTLLYWPMAFPSLLVNEGLPQLGALQNAALLSWPQNGHVAVLCRRQAKKEF
jgi:hypothetical protein